MHLQMRLERTKPNSIVSQLYWVTDEVWLRLLLGRMSVGCSLMLFAVREARYHRRDTEGSLMPDSGFVDYYELLQISPNAEPETIHRVYKMLAQRYHPDNPETGDTAR